jgi:hypothetical protein
MKKTIVKTLSKGDTVKLSRGNSVVESNVQQKGSGKLKLIAVYEAEADCGEHVILTSRFEDSDEIDVPEGAEILAVSDGNGMSNPVCWMAVPTDSYGGDDE